MKKLVQTQPGEKLIYPPVVYSYNHPFATKDEPVIVPYDMYITARRTMRVGDDVMSFAAAPGTGVVVERITRMDDTGVYGVEVVNTVRELDPSEVI